MISGLLINMIKKGLLPMEIPYKKKETLQVSMEIPETDLSAKTLGEIFNRYFSPALFAIFNQYEKRREQDSDWRRVWAPEAGVSEGVFTLVQEIGVVDQEELESRIHAFIDKKGVMPMG